MRGIFLKSVISIMMVAALTNIVGCSSQQETVDSNVSVNTTITAETIDKLKLAVNEEGTELNYYSYNSMADGYLGERSDIVSPQYFIFAGNKSEEEANSLISELNMLENIQQWGSTVAVINPINGDGYTEEDKEAFIDLVGDAIRNVKVIGIDEGATFVNNNISQISYFVAGIMTYGGEINEGLEKNDVVPVYLSNPAEGAVDFYSNINGVNTTEEKEDYTVYSNSEERFQNVVVANKEETLAEAFANGWEAVFSRNYRQHNSIAEFYMLNARAVTEDYDLIEVPVFEDLGIVYNQMIDEKVSVMDGEYTWFEYVPNTVADSEEGTVPLIVTLHGNENDPRLQGDSTGWPELAAKENFIVVSPEWQDKEVNFFGCDGLGDEGVMHLISDLQEKYPQIDSSRIYLSGLSIGGAKTFELGLKHNDVFAAVGVVAGVNVFAEQVTEISNNYDGGEVPLLYLCGDHDFFQMIPVDGSSEFGTQFLFGNQVWDEDENTHIFSSLQAYQRINGLEVTEMDMSLNEYYGIALDNQDWVTLGKKDMLTGTLSNENGVVMELGAIKDLAHWNYKPQAEYIWDFFNNYSRNTETGALNFN